MGVRRVALSALLALAACGGGQGSFELAVVEPVAQLPAQLVVEIGDGQDPIALAEALQQDYPGVTLERIGATPYLVVTPVDAASFDTLLDSLKQDPRLKDAHPDYTGSSPVGGPSEAPILGGDLTGEFSTQPALEAIGALDAQLLSTGAGVTVAVLDTGVEFGHPLLAGSLRGDGWDFVGDDADPSEEHNGLDDDGDGVIDGQYGHGTFVASLVLAVAPDARILPVRVLDDEGYGHTSRLAEGIYWAVERGARVINVSMELTASPRVIQDAVRYALDRGVLVLAAAGNDGGQSIPYPAKDDEVVAVTALAPEGLIAPFANYGDKVALALPGVDLVGAAPVDLGGSARWSGTSFASPLAAGGAALLLSLEPALDGAAARDRLMRAVAPLPPESAPIAGGRLDLRALLAP